MGAARPGGRVGNGSKIGGGGLTLLVAVVVGYCRTCGL